MSVTTSGDGWVMHLGDSIRAAWPEVDHMITDPPYAPHVHARHRTAAGGLDIRSNVEIDFRPFGSLDRVLVAAKATGSVRRWTLIYTDAETVHEWQDALTWMGLRYLRTGVWHKTDATPQVTGDRPGASCESICIAHAKGRSRWNGGGCHGFWSYPAKDGKRVHMTQKPVPLLERQVEQFSDPGETIIDPFAGSGSVGVAAVRMGRRFVGYERDPKHYAAACARLSATRQQVRLPFGAAKRARSKQSELAI